MIAALLGWTKLPQWGMELLFTVLLILVMLGAVLYWHHRTLELGIKEQRAADAVATAKVQAQAAVETAALQSKADAAEKSHAEEIEALTAQLNAAPTPPVRLCVSHNRGTSVPQARTASAEPSGTSTRAAALQPVPPGDSGGRQATAGPDISNLLGLLALQADTVSAELREYQAR